MDLRKYSPSSEQVDKAATVLNYQPFIITDDLQTGGAYSWAYADDPRERPALVFRRDQYPADEWERITDTNARLRNMYDGFISEISKRYPGGSLFDCACNNGYFPVAAEINGMHGTGFDLGDFSASISLLNDLCGTNARFLHNSYDSTTHKLPVNGKYDVVVASAIMCHLPDPLYFLRALGEIANEALFFWGQIVDTDNMIVSFNRPHLGLSNLTEFPHSFNDNTRISRGLFLESMRQMEFKTVIEIPWRENWLPKRLPYHFNDNHAADLSAELGTGSPHIAYLAMRS